MLAPNAMSRAPSLSVILTNLNGGSRLGTALASVWEQRSLELEVIVVDRGSKDESHTWLTGHRARLAALEFADGLNEADAANRGLTATRGEWVLFLRSGDRLVGDNILSECLNWTKKTEAGVVAGEAAMDDGRIFKLRSQVNAIARNFVPESAALYRRTLFDENGPLDASLGTMAWYEFNLRLWKGRVRFKPIPLRVVACGANAPYDWTACREEIRVRHRYFTAWRCWPRDVLSMMRGLKLSRQR